MAVIALALALVAIVLGGLLLADRASRSDDEGDDGWVRTGAVVLDVEGPSSDRDPTSTVSVAYRVGSSELRADIETRYDDFDPTVDVEYDPAHPADVRIAGEDRNEGGIVSTIVFVVVIGAAMAAVVAGRTALDRWGDRRFGRPS